MQPMYHSLVGHVPAVAVAAAAADAAAGEERSVG